MDWTASHPDKGTFEVTEEVAQVLRNRAGWTISGTSDDDQADDSQAVDGQEDVDMPDKADDLVTWIGDNPDRAAAALEAEQARPKPRTTVTDHIAKVLDPNTTPDNDQADDGQED